MSFMLRKSQSITTAQELSAESSSIIAVTAGKGGVGKTFMAIMLANAFTKTGKRTLLIDGDLGLPNIDVQLGITPEHDLTDVIAGRVKLDAAVAPFHGGAGKGGFDVVSGHSSAHPLSEEEVEQLADSISELALQYDKVVLDLGAGLNEQYFRLAKTAHKAISVMTTDEPSSMTDAYAFIKVLRGYAPKVEAMITIINRADSRITKQRIYEKMIVGCERFLGFKPRLLELTRGEDALTGAA